MCSRDCRSSELGATLNQVGAEVVILNAIKEIIDSIVTFEVIELRGDDGRAEVWFKSITHSKFVNIVLVDLLTELDKKRCLERVPY